MPSMTSEDAAAMHAPSTRKPKPCSRNGGPLSKSTRYPKEPAQLLEILRSCALSLLARPGINFADPRVNEWLISFSVLPGMPEGFSGPLIWQAATNHLRWYLMYPGSLACLCEPTATATRDLSLMARALNEVQCIDIKNPVDYSTPFARNLARTIVKLAGTFHHHAAHARKVRARELHAERSAARQPLPESP